MDAWGWTARVILRKGTTAAQAINQLPAIESGLGLRPGSARAIPDSARADRFTLRVIEKDPHAQPIPWHAPSSATITAPVGLGLFEDGRPARVLILRRNVLIGGTTGAGKSGIVNVILAALAACGDVVVWGVDLKGGMELGPGRNASPGWPPPRRRRPRYSPTRLPNSTGARPAWPRGESGYGNPRRICPRW